MKFGLILFVMWGYGFAEPVTMEFDDERACVNAAMDIYNKVQAASQLMDAPLVIWGCEPTSSE